MTSRRREIRAHDTASAKRELGIRVGACQRTRPRTGQETEYEQAGEPDYRREREDGKTKWAAYLLANGGTEVQPLTKKISGNLIRKCAVFDTKTEAMTAAQGENGVDSLNMMMHALVLEGIDAGYTEGEQIVADLGVRIPMREGDAPA